MWFTIEYELTNANLPISNIKRTERVVYTLHYMSTHWFCGFKNKCRESVVFDSNCTAGTCCGAIMSTFKTWVKHLLFVYLNDSMAMESDL